MDFKKLINYVRMREIDTCHMCSASEISISILIYTEETFEFCCTGRNWKLLLSLHSYIIIDEYLLYLMREKQETVWKFDENSKCGI